MTQRTLVVVVALLLGLQACTEHTRSSARDAGGDKTAMTVASAHTRDAGSDEVAATLDAGDAAPVDAGVPDAGAPKPARRPASEHDPRRAAMDAAMGGTTGGTTGGSKAEHAAIGGVGGSATAAGARSAGAGGGGDGGAAPLAAGQGGGTAGAAAPEADPKTFAAGLSELLIDMPCDPATPTPLAEGIACSHAANATGAEKVVTFGGKAGTRYALTLRVRAVWEPTEISDGVDPYPGIPFTVGGHVAQNPDGTPTNSINYQQFQIQVAEPAQTFWLNNYHAAAHEIHKEDYQARLEVAGGSEIKIIVHDGNDLEISNFRQLMFTDFPPYDKMPSLGQSLRLDVVDVVALP